MQGLAIGGTTLTASAPGYTTDTSTITVDPSGFIIYSPGDFSTTPLSADTVIAITPARLNPMTLNLVDYENVRGGLTVNVGVTSSDTSVGTITASPIAFTGGSSFLITTFHPVAVGTSTVAVAVPTGFSAPSNYRQITATVTVPFTSVSSSPGGRAAESGRRSP
ncbi:MAG: hypothetical protein DMG07_27495 [Acidobacteria bacterium]|nr:MAG: hypothetical protein DMG07_27495 [Acidobacteriota bacterium]